MEIFCIINLDIRLLTCLELLDSYLIVNRLIKFNNLYKEQNYLLISLSFLKVSSNSLCFGKGLDGGAIGLPNIPGLGGNIGGLAPDEGAEGRC